MSSDYKFNPSSWSPIIAGVTAGATAAIVAGLVSVFLRSPDEIVANSLTVVLVSLALGAVSGLLWRKLRAEDNAVRTFSWTMVGAFVVAMLAVTLADQTALTDLNRYAVPLAAIIFITLGFLTPVYDRLTVSPWFAVIPVVIALAIGVGMFGRGNVASGELSLDDLPAVTTTVAAAADEATTTSAASSSLQIPDDLAGSYTVASGVATYSVEEILQGLATQGVGVTEEVTGSIAPGGEFEFTIDLQSFESDQSRRDGKVSGWFEEFPTGTFAGSDFALPSTAEVGEVVTFDIVGDFTINDITEEVSWAIEARVEADNSLSLAGETFIVLSDFDVPVQDSGFIVMEDGATLEILLVASPV